MAICNVQAWKCPDFQAARRHNSFPQYCFEKVSQIVERASLNLNPQIARALKDKMETNSRDIDFDVELD